MAVNDITRGVLLDPEGACEECGDTEAPWGNRVRKKIKVLWRLGLMDAPDEKQWSGRMVRRLVLMAYTVTAAVACLFYFLGVLKPDVAVAAIAFEFACVPLVAFTRNTWEIAGGQLGLLSAAYALSAIDSPWADPPFAGLDAVLKCLVAAVAGLALILRGNARAIKRERETRTEDLRSMSKALLRALKSVARLVAAALLKIVQFGPGVFALLALLAGDTDIR